MVTSKLETCNSCNPAGSNQTTTYIYSTTGNSVNLPLSIQKTDQSKIDYAYMATGLPDLKSSVLTDPGAINSFTTTYSYYPDGALRQTTFPNGVQLKNIYLKGFKTQITDALFNPYWTMGDENEAGQPYSYTYGSSMQMTAGFEYDNWRYPLTRGVYNSSSSDWAQGYVFDPISGNLSQRSDLFRLPDHSEDFSYYNQTQLMTSSLTNPGSIPGYTPFNINYFPEGNFESKDDIGTYSHIAHAVTQVTGLPGLPSAINAKYQEARYTAFSKISRIEEDNANFSLDVLYTPDNERISSTLYDIAGTPIKKKFFTGSHEKIIDLQTNNTKEFVYINSPYGLVGAIVKINNGPPIPYYIATDYLGSISAVYDQSLNLVEENSYDAWGRRRDPDTWQNYSRTFPAPQPLFFERGYTSHEHLDEFDLINMNGRMYDPLLCKMLSPDNYNSAPGDALGLNRYAYAMNNPLVYSDPSGDHPIIVAALIGAAIGVTANGINNSFNNEPFFKNAGTAAFVGAVGGMFSYGIGQAAAPLAGMEKVVFQTTMHAHLGGTLTAASGGNYIQGFVTGAISSGAASATSSLLRNAASGWQVLGSTATGALIGGGTAEIMGGNFWDGVRNGAISSLLNHSGHIVFNNYLVEIQVRSVRAFLGDLGYDAKQLESDVVAHREGGIFSLKYAKFNAPYRYYKSFTQGHWDSYSDTYTAWLSKTIQRVGRAYFQLKYYPDRNSSIGIIQAMPGHIFETIGEKFDGYMRDSWGYPDNYFYHMHEGNALYYLKNR